MEILSPDDDAFHAGEVTGFKAESGEHEVMYADGNREWIYLFLQTTRWPDGVPLRLPPLEVVEPPLDGAGGGGGAGGVGGDGGGTGDGREGEAAVAAVAATATVVVEEEEVQAVVVAAEAIGRSGGVAAVNRAPREREAVAVPALTRA